MISISIAYSEFNTYIKTELEEPNQLKFSAVTIQFTRTYFKEVGYDEIELFALVLFGDDFLTDLHSLEILILVKSIPQLMNWLKCILIYLNLSILVIN